jgi:putative addiction module component (TIGR02574 family)
MTTTIEKEFRSLTVAERVNLVEELREQVAAEPEALPVPDWQIKELERRRRLYQANPQRAIPWAQAKVQILKRHAKRLIEKTGQWLNLIA